MTDTITISLLHGDCIERLKAIPSNSIGAVITDPPYLIGFMGRDWDKAEPEEPVEDLEEEDQALTASDMQGQQAWHRRWLTEVFRVLRPGGILKVFSATRTFHRPAAAMEEVGFVLDPKNSLEAWGYGQGFPKSLNVSKAIDKMLGVERKVIGHIGAETPQTVDRCALDFGGATGKAKNGLKDGYPVTIPATDEGKKFEGFGTAAKPAWEPFIVGTKPLPASEVR